MVRTLLTDERNRAGSRRGRAGWYVVALVVGGLLLTVCMESARRAFSSRYSNHWGLDTFVLACLCVFPLLWSLIGLRLRPRPWPAIIILSVLACVTMVGLFIFDHHNVLVYYEAWLERGMPERWTH
jgi:hypothetical protein